MSEVEIRQLKEKDVEVFRTLRLEGLQKSPDAFGATYEQEVKQDNSFFVERIERSIIVGCFDGDDLVGMTCCLQDGSIKCKHVALIWGVYLKEKHRGQGISKKLFEKILSVLPEDIEQIRLSVASHNKAAKKLYQSFGFEKYGYEERVLKIDNKYYDEILMVKFLK